MAGDSNILGQEWRLNKEGLNSITENGTLKDYKKVYKSALDSDLKEIGSPFLKELLSEHNITKSVLQIQKIRNISAPKANENSQAAPRMLKLTLTDGDSYIQAIEIGTIGSISRDKTPPGTKVLINNAKIVSGHILIGPKNCTVLGGEVSHLHEKWMLAKSVQNTRQDTSSSNAPPWVNFGSRIQSNSENAAQFKSLTAKQKENKDNAEFEQQRQEAIAEAATGAIRKTFGGRVKQNVQPTIRPNITNKRNNGKFNNNHKTRDLDEDNTKLIPMKPSDKVSLFSFLEDKLPVENSNSYQHTIKKFSQLSNGFSNDYPSSNSKPQNYQRNDKFSNQRNYSEQYKVKTNNLPIKHDNRNINTDIKPIKSSLPVNDVSVVPTSNGSTDCKASTTTITSTKPVNASAGAGTGEHKTSVESNLTTAMSKMSINNEFATRSLRQHLNLGAGGNNKIRNNEDGNIGKRSLESSDNRVGLNVGDECMAKYWEDGRFYNAIITAVTDKTYAVQFKGYGNIEEVLKSDCYNPRQNHYNKMAYNGASNPNNNQRNYSGTMEFRRTYYRK